MTATIAPGSGAPAYSDLKPELVWRMFAELAAIPRPSFHEEAVQKRILEMAAEHHLAARQDEAGNVVIDVPARGGMEDRPLLVLQAHTDMVSVKRDDSPHDFQKDPIQLVTDQHDGRTIVRADGTTLGADNGIGAACALAVAFDDSLAHPPLEILLTVNEESGMTGARALDADFVHGRRMLNLDTEEDDTIYIGCVGGAGAELVWERPLEDIPTGWRVLRVVVSGLRGGHSGLEIHQPRGNANRIMGRVLHGLPEASWALASISGGTLRNAIPSRCEAVIACTPEVAETLRFRTEQIIREARVRMQDFAGKLQITTDPSDGTDVLPSDVSAKIAKALAELPHGVLAMDQFDARTVESSCNVAVISTDQQKDRASVKLEISIRSLIRQKLDTLRADFEQRGKELGAQTSGKFSYPPWEPKHGSAMLTTAKEVHQEVYNREPKVASIHGGLECGILSDRIPEMEMVSVGPLIQEAHTPDERVFVDSVERFWQYLVRLLKAL